MTGFCDFMFVANPEALNPRPPIIVLVEAKKQDLMMGVPQCVAEMLAARNLNRKAGLPYQQVFGCVTIGQEWIFLQLTDKKASIHDRIFLLTELDQILAAFTWMINQFQSNG